MINKLENRDSLLETIIVLANDELVNLFLLKKINFTDITYYLQKIINMKEFKKLRFIKPGNIKSIFSLNKLIRFNINNFF
jgi:1-deoxy-D-xylulose-5-phosphate reductoisomerase